MALSEEKLQAIQIVYELGKVSKTQICKDHRISRPTLRKHAKEGEWIYQKSFQEVAKEVRARVTEKMIERSSEEIVKATEIFLDNSSNVRDFVMLVADKLKEKIKNDDWDFKEIDLKSFFDLQKFNEISSKTLTGLYSTDRKALGLDKDDDIDRARRIKYGETDGTGSNKLQERIKEKMKANGFDD